MQVQGCTFAKVNLTQTIGFNRKHTIWFVEKCTFYSNGNIKDNIDGWKYLSHDQESNFLNEDFLSE